MVPLYIDIFIDYNTKYRFSKVFFFDACNEL